MAFIVIISVEPNPYLERCSETLSGFQAAGGKEKAEQ
jgi:hypothetical protein